jgi:hypothetical protein
MTWPEIDLAFEFLQRFQINQKTKTGATMDGRATPDSSRTGVNVKKAFSSSLSFFTNKL